MLLDKETFDDENKRWDMIQRYLIIAPNNHRFIPSLLKWLKRHAPEKLQSIARHLLDEPGQGHQVICTALGLLDRGEAQPFAKELLAQSGQEHQVICTALGLLDRGEAQPFAKELLAQPGQEYQVICTALGLLDRGEAQPFAQRLLAQPGQHGNVICTALGLLDRGEAQPFAKELLAQSGQEHQVICTALGLLDRGDTEEYALNVLNDWNVYKPTIVLRCLNILPEHRQVETIICNVLKNKKDWLYFQVLRYSFPKVKCWRKETRQVIQEWWKYNRLLVMYVLKHYLNDEEFLRNPCQAMLNRWKEELDYKHKKNIQQYPGYILKALAHQQLRKQAKAEATKMLLYESAHPGILGDELFAAAEAIVKENRYPDWFSTVELSVTEEIDEESD